MLIPFYGIINEPDISEYEKALAMIIESEEYHNMTNNKKKYSVSDEVIVYSKLGKHFMDDLKNNKPLTQEEIAENAYQQNTLNEKLLGLNKKKCGTKVQVFFSEITENIFFAEIFESKKKFSYKDRPNFGVSYIYMFKIGANNSLSLIKTRELIYN